MAKPFVLFVLSRATAGATAEGLDSESELDSAPVPWAMDSALESDFHSVSDLAVALLESVSASDSEPESDSAVALSESVSALDWEPESDSDSDLATEFDSVSDSQ